MTGINLTFKIESEDDDATIIPIFDKYDFEEHKTTNEHQKWIRRGIDLVIIRFDRKILIQGKEHEQSLNFLREILALDILQTDRKNAEKLAKLFKISHNALFCMKCNSPSMLIKGKIEGLDITFEMECGHKNDLNPPIFMLTSRIMPDTNILINGNLSRCIDMGFFEGFEIVISDFQLHAIDYLGRNKKAGASNELQRLHNLENEDKITIFKCVDGIPIPSTEEFDQIEDDKMLEIANLTNSILLTGDMNLKDKARMDKRPTIYIHPSDGNQIKIIHQTRNP